MDAPAVCRIENACVVTLDRHGPATASSIDLHNGRIERVDDGRASSARQGQDDGAQSGLGIVLDAGGRTVVPGFIDSHQHTILGGLSLGQLDLSSVSSRAEFEQAVAEAHAALPSGRWLQGWGWDEERWSGVSGANAYADRRAANPPRDLPDRTWLAACGDRPAVCWRLDHHACVVNDAVLVQLDLAADPAGGRIVRDADGRPTGLLQEAAAWQLVRPLIPAPSLEERREALRQAGALLRRLGVTTAMTMETAADVRDVLLPARDGLGVRLLVTLLDADVDQALRCARDVPADERLRIIGCKSFIDGTLGSRTARMLEEYADDPGNRGIFLGTEGVDDLHRWAERVADAGLSPSMHAIGDEALRLALEIAERLGPKVRTRVEHAQTVHGDDLPRTSGRWLSMQPLQRAYDAPGAVARLGVDRLDRFFPFRRLREAGARLAFGSDWPIVSPDPMLGMRAAITGLTVEGERFDVDQTLTPKEALAAYTRDAAAMLGADDRGVIRPGALADFVVLSCDPREADWTANPPRVEATVLGGRLVWRGV